MKIILIHPPIAKPSEPPAGLARLSACLSANFVEHRIIDANLEGMLYLMRDACFQIQAKRFSLRACKNLEQNLAALQNLCVFGNKSRYSRAVSELNHVLNLAGKAGGCQLSLSDYADARLFPVRSADLLRAAENPEKNPFYGWFSRRLLAVLAKSPDYIGFSLNFLSQALCALAMIGFIKKNSPGQKIILGGSLISSWAHIYGKKDYFSGLADEVVTGPGEDKLLKLLGINEVKQGISTDYRLFSGSPYLSPGFVLPYSSASGCWWRKCLFCPETSEKSPYLPLAPSRVADELSKLTSQTNPSLLHFLDSSLAPGLLSELIKNPLGVPWYGFARVTHHLTDEDFCRALKKSGCVLLQLGIESGSKTVLDQLNKGIDLQAVDKALKMLKKCGIATYGYFLFGTPAENEKAAYQTLDFICRHADCLAFLNLAIFNLPAGSLEAQSLATDDFYGGDLSLYKSFVHPLGWRRAQVRNFLDKIVKRHAVVAPIVKRLPEYFTSNHAPFLVMREGS